MMIEPFLFNGNNFRKGLFSIILIEYICFIISGVSFQGLHHVAYFNFGIDPIYWLFFLLQIPQFVFTYHKVGIILDILIILLLTYSVFIKEKKFVTWSLFILLTMYYVSLTATLGHRNYQTGFFILTIPFLFSNHNNRKFAFEGIRYFFIFFYFSSSIFKIINQGIADPLLFSSILKTQFIPYYIEANYNWRTILNTFLIKHYLIGYLFYLFGTAIEFIFIITFFSKKYDFWIGILLLILHISNWIFMDIAPIGQLSVIYFFIYSKKIIAP